MNPTNFDELTKELAKSTSRRHALKTILTASIGGVVGLGAIRSVFGNKIKCGGGPSNSDCAHWCAAVFGPNTPAAGQCTSDAAHNRGACCQCGAVEILLRSVVSGIAMGSASPAPSLPGASAIAVSAKPAIQVQAPALAVPRVRPARTDSASAPAATIPAFAVPTSIAGEPPACCFCGGTTEGGSVCFGDDLCDNLQGCNSSADCPAGRVCLTNSCCGVNVCIASCGADAPAAFRALSGTGPTATHR